VSMLAAGYQVVISLFYILAEINPRGAGLYHVARIDYASRMTEVVTKNIKNPV